jgi:hypothetical protein
MKLLLLTLLIGFSAPDVLCQSSNPFGSIFSSVSGLINGVIGTAINATTNVISTALQIPVTLVTGLSGLSIKFICLKKKNKIVKDLIF